MTTPMSGTPEGSEPAVPGAAPGPPPGAPSGPPPGGGPAVPGPPAGPWASDNLPQHPMAFAPRPDVPQPKSILQAVRLMFVGAAISAIGVLLTFTQTDAIREAIEDSDSSLTESEVDAAVTVGMGFAVVVGLIAVGLWIWMAVTNGQGKSWARVVATVFGALNVASTLFGLAGGGSTPVTLVTNLVSLVLAAAILFLLYRPESSRYYEAKSG